MTEFMRKLRAWLRPLRGRVCDCGYDASFQPPEVVSCLECGARLPS